MLTFFTLFLLVSAVIGVHRLYNYEEIFAPIRNAIGYDRAWLKPIWCAKCNAFWIAIVILCVHMLVPEPWSTAALTVLAIYPWVRATMWMYAVGARILGSTVIPTLPVNLAASAEVDALMAKKREEAPKQVLVPAPAATAPEQKPGCAPCESAKKASEKRQVEQKKNLGYERRFVLMTPMITDWSPSYSVAAVILDQARMLAADPKNLVQVWVTTTCNAGNFPALPENVEIKKVLPPIPLTADYVDEKARDLFFGQILQPLLILGNATIIAHDLLFVNSYLTIAAAIHEKLASVNGFRWFHFCHSAPSPIRPADAKVLYRASLPEGHRLMCLAESQKNALATYYGVDPSRVDVVPNARDLRTLTSVSPRIFDFISKHQLLTADIVQVLPLSTPRAGAKGLSHIIAIFAALARRGKTVRLVVANAHANQNEGVLIEFMKIAKAAGLPEDALVFTSLAFPDLAVFGLPTADVQALFQVSNLFVFPTISEACSLTLMEAAANGCHLVLNASTPSLFDIVPKDACRSFHWGSVTEKVLPGDMPDPDHVAAIIVDDLAASLANRSKRAVLRTHSLDAVGARLRAVVTANLVS
jgi:glycosyltransferase involved in cell wall biosynthesis